MDWSKYLDDFGRKLLEELGEDPYLLPRSYNPITRALREPDFVERHQDMVGFNRMALSRVATICQMSLFDAQHGPESDGECKALRRHWYQWYKLEFSQPLALQIGDFEVNTQGVKVINDIAWTQRLSQTYAEFVDTGELTYKDLWVEDASRMMTAFWSRLFKGCHIVVAVEKDSLFADFKNAATALGAHAVYSGKGKSSKAAIEKLLRDHFGWYGDWDNEFSYETPLIILSITDWDCDGEAVIAPTFAEQARRYTSHILEARVGISPPQVTENGYEWPDKWYTVKVSNSGYKSWAEDNALFLATCQDCMHQWPVVGVYWKPKSGCPMCGGPAELLEVGSDPAHGFEVEALPTRAYRRLLVDALLSVLPFDYIVEKLRDECRADSYSAADEITTQICEANETYQKLLDAFKVLEAAKDEFEQRVKDTLQELAEPRVNDWRDDDDDPEPEDFRQHVEDCGSYSSPWRPFKKEDRTAKLVEWMTKNLPEIDEFKAEEIEWEV